ncbi:TenA family transcriptional regulator [Paludibacterium purpuratum]|uniref:Pyrroloquinoline quinone (PQQ) biosynthesis protein C n=1 Tax=Paludibacterium purpuratum TaxID=1144873 RepID=A0A4R7B579_9NEIS|nr:iron-containing redox enzyme family protein [Paludibacterium purpuratum]TDR79751.1 pyrroloquinoline quinone (PQQ) biosynthesis protein C [Paludibacterium purpuratum]
MDKYLMRLESAKAQLIEQIRSHSLLARCRAGNVTLDELKILLVQQGLYSAHFTRYLCAMMANLPSNNEVLELAENLFEELGLAPDSPQPHHLIYREMLDHYALTLDDAQPLSGTQRLIESMYQHCRDPNPASGLGALCLGAEALVPSIYSDIICGFESHGASQHDIAFFHIHVACDDGHAETIRDIMLDIASTAPEQIDVMIRAGTELVEARLAFFSAIEAAHQERQRAQPAIA